MLITAQVAGSDLRVSCSGSEVLERMLRSAGALSFQKKKWSFSEEHYHSRCTGVTSDTTSCADGLILGCKCGVCGQSMISPAEGSQQVWMLD